MDCLDGRSGLLAASGCAKMRVRSVEQGAARVGLGLAVRVWMNTTEALATVPIRAISTGNGLLAMRHIGIVNLPRSGLSLGL